MNEKLNESLTDVVYHFTTLGNALNILLTRRFKLSNATFSKAESPFSPKEYPYFLSTTRSKVGEYHSGNNRGVVFVLDGRWFNSRYPSKPVDYWERSWNYPKSKKHSESEDRVFSKEPFIPTDGVKEIHVLLQNDDQDINSERARQILILAKTNNIQTYLYNNPKDWQLQNKNKALPINKNAGILRGHRKDAPYVSRMVFERNDLISLIELITKPTTATLTNGAKTLLSKIKQRPDYMASTLQDLLAARNRPSHGKEYDIANKIAQYLTQKKMSLPELMTTLKQKWKPQ